MWQREVHGCRRSRHSTRRAASWGRDRLCGGPSKRCCCVAMRLRSALLPYELEPEGLTGGADRATYWAKLEAVDTFGGVGEALEPMSTTVCTCGVR